METEHADLQQFQVPNLLQGWADRSTSESLQPT